MLTKDPQRRHFDIIAIGASAGGVEAISHLLELLPREIAATVLERFPVGLNRVYLDGFPSAWR